MMRKRTITLWARTELSRRSPGSPGPSSPGGTRWLTSGPAPGTLFGRWWTLTRRRGKLYGERQPEGYGSSWWVTVSFETSETSGWINPRKATKFHCLKSFFSVFVTNTPSDTVLRYIQIYFVYTVLRYIWRIFRNSRPPLTGSVF